MAAIVGERNFFGKLPKVHCLDTLWVESFDEITLSRTVKEIRSKLVFFHFWQKFENSKWPPFLGRGKFFGKLPIAHFFDTLCNPKKAIDLTIAHTKFGIDMSNIFP